ncbi:hypothetical protein TNCV_4297881 [Trichonephila clavipes]|nr:hypothetical protein TNCV_4297881 [Trichonephila clavipes]
MLSNSGNERQVPPQQTVRCLFFNMSTLGMLQLQVHIDNFVLPLDDTLPHWSPKGRDYLDEHLPHRWVGRIMDYNIPLS